MVFSDFFPGSPPIYNAAWVDPRFFIGEEGWLVPWGCRINGACPLKFWKYYLRMYVFWNVIENCYTRNKSAIPQSRNYDEVTCPELLPLFLP